MLGTRILGLVRASMAAEEAAAAAEVGAAPATTTLHHPIPHVLPTSASRILATMRATKDGGLDSGPVHWEALLLVTWRVIVAIEEVIRHSHVEAMRGETTREKVRLDLTKDRRRRRQVIRGTKVPALARRGGDNSVCNATKS